ncbi:sensor histidine kinase [Nitriliruptor alkaliphilus]|uniref:sensor histidine kinase n=1 Tax=Nitriliruptor alkaliphilus TaxID=427918 RepID=UPI0012EEB982|nr:sensor histidine kinase [Nitriliruptor alkaliphilus]
MGRATDASIRGTALRARVTVVWVGLGVAAMLMVAALTLIAATPSGVVESSLAGSRQLDAAFAVAFVAYSTVGAVIAARRPDHPVGWILLVAGLGFQTWVLAWWYAAAGLLGWPGVLPGAAVAAWLSLWIHVAGFGLAFTFLLQLFPDGSLPSRRWRPVAWFTGVALLVWAVTWATPPGPIPGFEQVDNPVGVAALARMDEGLGWGLFVLAVLASAISLVVRYVRSSGVARRQIRWLAYAAALVGVALVAVTVGSEGVRTAQLAGEVLIPLAIAGVPIAVFVAIFKHDLYDLDLVISKTITVGVLAALITLSYVAVVAGVGVAAGTAGELSLTLAVLVTAVVAVAFQPARARIGRLANRLVYGPRATPYEVLAAFAQQLGDTLEADAALPRLARIVGEGVGATVAEVWLVIGDGVRRLAAWPAQPARPVVALSGDGLPPLPHADRTVEIRDRGELLGAISVTLPPGRSLTPTEDRLLRDVAAQAGLVLTNVRLLEQLKASRQRLVAAQDEERRRIERDIHDGVQQQLVTLALTLKMAAADAGAQHRDGLDETLGGAAQEATATLAELRRLARGIHPSIVTEGGLAAAIESVVERAPLPVELQLAEVEGLPISVEVTVYYLVAEALTNVAKHADAASATVTVAREDGRLRVEIGDDGVGGAMPSAGSGLVGITDRIAALGGVLEIESPARAGTRLRAEIPCGS